ncbi:MAG: pyridoxal phosphate-dependent aminotransferase [Desulfobacterales bacterium]
MKPLSQLLGSVPPSATVAVADRARALKAEGRDIIALAGGDPDFNTPCHIVESAVAALHGGQTHYPPSRGTLSLRRAIASKLRRDNQVQVDPERQVLVSPGGKFALYAVLAALVNPGDEILIFDPYWVSYPPMVTLVGGVPVSVPLSAQDGFQIRKSNLEARLSPRTKAILLNTPNNPTGRVLSGAEAEIIRRIALDYDLYVIADEVYEALIFEGRHISMAALDGMAGRTVTLNALSKTYAMTGWRLGWAAGSQGIIDLAAKFQSQSVTSAASFSMPAAETALSGPQDEVARMRRAYQERRDYMVAALNAIPGVECDSPQGAFYLFVRFPGLKTGDSLQIAEILLEEAQVAATPGIAFGRAGEGHVRFSIATAMADLIRAVARIEKLMAG